MKQLLTALLVVIFIGCDDLSTLKRENRNDTLTKLSVYEGELNQHIVWQNWLISRQDKVNKMLKRDGVGFTSLSNYEQAILLRNQVRRMFEIYGEEMPERPTSTYYIKK